MIHVLGAEKVEEPLCLKEIKMPTPLKRKGRSKGCDLTVIGLPKKSKKTISFCKKSYKTKETLIFLWLLKTPFEMNNRIISKNDFKPIGQHVLKARPYK